MGLGPWRKEGSILGVLACSRSECENVMCSRYSPTFGYLCDECFDELVRCGVGMDIDEFLSRKIQSREKPEAVEKYFDILFPRNDT